MSLRHAPRADSAAPYMILHRFLVACAVLIALVAGTRILAADAPVTLKAMGSFYVGGQRVEIKHSGGVGPVRPGHINIWRSSCPTGSSGRSRASTIRRTCFA
jgi:hypothetical protein